MERLTDRTGMDTGAPVEAEQRCVDTGCRAGALSASHLLAQQLGHPWSERDEAALAELAAADDKDIVFQVDIAQA
jgi:hypothetical protein